MLKVLTISKSSSHRVILSLNAVKKRGKIGSFVQCCSFSCLSSKSYNKKGKIDLQINNKLIKQGFIDSSGLLRPTGMHYDYKMIRCLSDEVPKIPADILITPPISQIEGLTRLLVDSPPVEFFQKTLISLHSATGLPWWATIVLSAVAMKTVITLPCAIYQQYILAKVANLKYEMEEIVGHLKSEANRRVALGFTQQQSRAVYNKALKEKWTELIVRDNCHPMKGFVLIMTQLPMWIFFSSALRNLCFMLPEQTPLAQQIYMELTEQGFGWITNLAATDPYFILPIALGLFNLMNIEIAQMFQTNDTRKKKKVHINIIRGVSLALVPIAALLPSGMTLYWTASSIHGTFQNLLIVSPRVRRYCRIEWTEQELEHPYKHLVNRFQQRIPRKSSLTLKNPVITAKTTPSLKKQ